MSDRDLPFVAIPGNGLTIQCPVCKGTLCGTGWPIDQIEALLVAMRAGHKRCIERTKR